MFPEGGGLQEYVLAQVKTVPGRADQSGREQERAERAPIRAPTSAPAQAHTCAPLAASGRIRGCVKRAGADRLARCDRRGGAPLSRTAATEGDIWSFQRPPDHPHIADLTRVARCDSYSRRTAISARSARSVGLERLAVSQHGTQRQRRSQRADASLSSPSQTWPTAGK